jgi:hypothetical protein
MAGQWVAADVANLQRGCVGGAAALAYGTAAVSPNMDIANTVLFTYPTALIFASGYLLRWADIPKYWIWCARPPTCHVNPTMLPKGSIPGWVI